jgi:hypothetical protein
VIFGVSVAMIVPLAHRLRGVVPIQVFGISSCVDGEIAPNPGPLVQDRRFPGYVDRSDPELLLVGVIVFSLGHE